MTFAELPSLRGFQPEYHSGGPMRFHLPLLFDLVMAERPRNLVVLGVGEGDAAMTLCQALRETEGGARLVAQYRGTRDEAAADEAWKDAAQFAGETYSGLAQFTAGREGDELFQKIENGSLDLLLIDDCDDGVRIREELNAWQAKLSRNAVVLVHGIGLEREHSPAAAFRGAFKRKTHVEFPAGIGLGVVAAGQRPGSSVGKLIFGSEAQRAQLREIYRLVSERIDAQARAAAAEKRNAALEVREVWLDSLLANGWTAQAVMDEQARLIAQLERQLDDVRADRAKAQGVIDEQVNLIEELRHDRVAAQIVLDAQAAQIEEMSRERDRGALRAQMDEEQSRAMEELRRDRARAQLVMDAQQEQLQHWIGVHNELQNKLERLAAELKERKELIAAAKQACRRKGKCFRVAQQPKVKRTFGERVARELQRLPRNLGLAKAPAQEAKPKPPCDDAAPAQPLDRYEEWIKANEPDAAALEKQRSAAAQMTSRAQLSVVVPVFNTPQNFLDELIGSLVRQTYDNWQLCIADGGSTDASTMWALNRWEKEEPRVLVVRLGENRGISENTNAALKSATGDFILLVDHDDLLPPFAFYEMTRAIAAHPDADIFYSDEDRLSPSGKRHTPFFKPDWSPALLTSFMYIGHLTAYRRSLVEELGGFRKEYDLSQDYDFALRATERARAVIHVPHVCYHWREHRQSANTGAKPHARTTNLAALGDAMRRRNLPAEIIEYPTANRARLKIPRLPRVSIIVPTDSPTRARACLLNLPRKTSYPDLEIVIVTNSRLLRTLRSITPANELVQLVAYDKPFNFSEKCNAGAKVATGTRLIFFNDDVEAEQADWVENVIEQLENPEIGAVSPKLLYESGKIQHAGLVTGVRGFAGTAFHQRDANWTDYFNMAQSLRDVSALSGACLAMRRDDFRKVGGFDAIDTPIAHSDFDLCFKVREAGLRCVYTPFVTLRHVGHVSIGDAERTREEPKREKTNVFLLRRWAGYTTHDPFFPDHMRDWLYIDSPTLIRMSGHNNRSPASSEADLLFVSHDLSWSGAPLLVLEIAKWCSANGFFSVVMSPKDGPLRERFDAAGIPVIVDPLIITGHESFVNFAREFDCVIPSTIFGAPIVNAARKAGLPHLWWIHEGRVAEHYISADAHIRKALAAAEKIVTPDARSAQLYQPFSDRPVQVVPYGIADPAAKLAGRARTASDAIRFLLLGTIEQRKGQRVLLDSLGKLPADVLIGARFHVIGRAHDELIAQEIDAATKKFPSLHLSSGVSPDEALQLIADTDVMLSASWDETGPLILMEAAAFGKALVSTPVGAVGEVLEHDRDALFFSPGDADALAKIIARLVRQPELLQRFGKAARAAYEKHFAFERFANDFSAVIRQTLSAAVDRNG